MNRRNAWRLLGRVARSLQVPDTTVARPNGRLALLSCSDVDRAMKANGRRFSPLLEGIRQILEPLGFATVNLSHPYAVFRSERVKEGSITLNYRALAIRLRSLARRVGGESPVRAARSDREERMYAGLLRRLDPEIVFSIQPPAALCRAARRLGIPLVEAMHGTHIGLDDRIYRAHMALPDSLLPQYLLSFDEVTQATNATLCAGRDIVAVRGNDPWLHACRQGRELRQVGAGSARASAAKRVLVTLQWGYDGERSSLSGVIPNGILHPALEAAIAAGAQRGTAFSLRMHPIQANSPGYAHHRRYLETLARRLPNVEVERATDEPLPLLLDEASVHVTMSSSAVGEAAAASVPSLMLCPTLHAGGAHHGFFKELESAGWVTFGELDATAITAWIDRPPLPAEVDRLRPDPVAARTAEADFYSDLIERARAAAGSTRCEAIDLKERTCPAVP